MANGSHCSAVRPDRGQKARATPTPRQTTATMAPTTVGRQRRASTPTTRLEATAAIWPPRHPAITPLLSRGENR